MKDSSVGPAGLFDTRRQRKLLDGLADRFQSCLDQQRTLRREHDGQRASEEQEFSEQRAAQTAKCRGQRRSMLREWDDVEEQLINHYETTAIRSRLELTRLAAVFRRKAAEERKAIELKVQQREQALNEQYESSKNQPGLLKRKEIKRIDDSLLPLRDALEQARELTIRRLDGLPDVSPDATSEQGVQAQSPDSVDQTIASIQDLTKQCEDVIDQMHRGTASRIVDSFLLPLAGVAFAILWALIAYFVGPDPRWLWMLAGIIPASVIVFIVWLILMVPLKRMTAQLFPTVVRIGQAADQCAAEGRKIASHHAAEAAAELVHRRDSQIEAAQKWQAEQLAALSERLKKEQEDLKAKLQHSLVIADEEYTRNFTRVGNEMRAKADELAHSITDQLSSTDREIQRQRELQAAARYTQLQHLSNRLKAGVSQGLKRITSSCDQVTKRFPDWNTVLTSPLDGDDHLDFVPVGRLQVRDSLTDLLRPKGAAPPGDGSDANGAAADEETPELLADTEIPSEIPVVLHRRLHSGLVIQAPPQYMDRAIDLAHQVLWRLLTGAPPSRAS